MAAITKPLAPVGGGIQSAQEGCPACDYAEPKQGGHCYMFREKPEGSCAQFKRRLQAASTVGRAHCTRCGSTFFNIDGCPVCGTDRYLTHDSNQ